jgi:hypothetical protein
LRGGNLVLNVLHLLFIRGNGGYRLVQVLTGFLNVGVGRSVARLVFKSVKPPLSGHLRRTLVLAKRKLLKG